MLVPTKGKVLIEPVLHSDIRSEETEKRSGLFVPKPSNKLYDFEGVPSVGIVRNLPKGYEGVIEVGDRVVFSELKPHGFKHDGTKLFCLEVEQVIAIIGGK